METKRKKLVGNFNSNVPSTPYAILIYTIIVIITLLCFMNQLIANCEHHHFRPLTSSQFDDDYLTNEQDTFVSPQNWNYEMSKEHNRVNRATPPLDDELIPRRTHRKHRRHFYAGENSPRSYDDTIIRPAKVYSEHFTYGPDKNFYSPIFDLQLTDLNNQPAVPPPIPQNQYGASQQSPTPSSSVDAINGFDLIEPGSGGGWDNHMSALDATSNLIEDSTTLGEFESTNLPLQPTPVMTPAFGHQATPYMVENNFNRAPILNRRLPKLSATAGQIWNYFVPFDTFTDEDGDLRQLKSTIYFKNSSTPTSTASTLTPINDYYSWLQYDADSQLLYGLPTEKDVGNHELVLEVTNRWGAATGEIFEIQVKRHPSIRAFTHLFVINRIEWDQQRYPSIVDALGELVKRISALIYSDEPFKNSIVQYYDINNLNTMDNSFDPAKMSHYERHNNNVTMSFNLGWSNSSIPIYPCNLSKIETLARLLVDQQALNNNWSLEGENRLVLAPSQHLIKALAHEFRPSSVSINLQGSCEGRATNANSRAQKLDESTVAKSIVLRERLGKLTWKLGEPIEYQIPTETFDVITGPGEEPMTTRDLQLTLHTIDGLVFNEDPGYSFLDFDHETQTLFGSSYDLEIHSGQKEILLIARHPKSGFKVREVFILDIEAHDLTSLNNRAFRMSLYLVPRTGLFGPRERVGLSRKIVGAIRKDDADFRHLHKIPEFIVTRVQKFAIGSYSKNPANLNYMLAANNYQDKIIRTIDNSVLKSDEAKAQMSSQDIHFYKFTWTNGTIGYRGDCPVEVIKENILFALGQSMTKLELPDSPLYDDKSKNESARFYDRLRFYFEPDSDLIHLRFEPLGACLSALEIHDVGNSEFADLTDRAKDSSLELLQEVSTPSSKTSLPMQEVEVNSDELWSIVVLIVLVLVLIFVIVMFFLGMHTYKINQDKRMELQIRLAQARQNSMFMSSMILANQAAPSDIYGHFDHSGVAKSMLVVQDEEKGARKPVILDNEKQLLTNMQRSPQSTTVQLSGQTVHTHPLKSSMTFTMDSIGSIQPSITQSPSRIIYNQFEGQQRSMTLNRRPSNTSIQKMSGQQTLMNHSHSILTVASPGPLTMMPPGRYPLIYAQVPAVSESIAEHPQDYTSLQRRYGQ